MCRGWSLAGVSLRGRGDGFPAFPDIQGHCSLLLSWTQPFSSWPSQIRSRSPSNTPSQGWCSAHAPVSRACPFLFFRRISLLTFVLPDPSMGKGEGRLGEGRRREERRRAQSVISFCPASLGSRRWSWRYAEVGRPLEHRRAHQSRSLFLYTLCSSFPSQGITDETMSSNPALGQLGSKYQSLWLLLWLSV